MKYQLIPDRSGDVRARLGDITVQAPDNRETRLSKLVFDKAFALAAIILGAPVFVVVAAAILISEGRPIVYGQKRVGKNYRVFRCWKFRTMVRDADKRLEETLKADPKLRAQWLETRKLEQDPRINRLGSLLRKTSLDELPQFWNVLMGDMSIVGPRPVVPDELKLYGRHSVDYAQVRPGLTGAWQVSGRSNTTYSERVALDVDYVAASGFWLDVQIVAKTVLVVFRQVGAR